MRYEALDFKQKISFFQRLHKKLNKELFAGTLSALLIDVRNLNKTDDKSKWYFAKYCPADLHGPERILFTLDFEDTLEQFQYQYQQANFITQIMLHEMVHQYCAQNSIDDSGHSEKWQQAAKDHGLISIYLNGNGPEKEYLIGGAAIIAAETRIR